MLTYVLPLRSTEVRQELGPYVAWLSLHCEGIVVDGSAAAVFEQHGRMCGPHVRHVAVDPGLQATMGKVGGVLTGVQLASSSKIVIADEVRSFGYPGCLVLHCTTKRHSMPAVEQSLRDAAMPIRCRLIRNGFFPRSVWHAI